MVHIIILITVVIFPLYGGLGIVTKCFYKLQITSIIYLHLGLLQGSLMCYLVFTVTNFYDCFKYGNS